MNDTQPSIRGRLVAIALGAIVAAGIVTAIAAQGGEEPSSAPREQPPSTAHDHGDASDATEVGTEDGRRLYRLGEGTLLISEWGLDRSPTGAERRAGGELAGATIESARRFRDLEDAEDAGYRQLDAIHWLRLDSMTDDRTADPNDPEGLLYIDDPTTGEKVLVAAMFVAPPGAHGPQFGGPDTVWHFHDYPAGICLVDGVMPISEPDPDGSCQEGEAATRSPEMLHVWIANPNGRFDHTMSVEADVLAATRSANS